MPLTGAVVLVVEDNPDHRTVTRVMLESLGAGVLVAANGTEGLDQLRRRMPDLILCDLRMPGMDGLEFARRVRAQSRYRLARLIALTALDPWESALQTWRVGFDAHLTKPVTVETLAALNRFLARSPRPPNLSPPN